MLDSLIHFLDGATRAEFSALNTEYNQQRELVHHYRAREEQLRIELMEEKAERKYLQDIIFKHAGVIPDPDVTKEIPLDEALQPINTAPRRMSTVLRQMEQDDRWRVASQEKQAQIPNALP